MLQFGIKFFAATAGFMVLILWLSSDLPGLRNWRLLYAYFTIVVVLSEKARARHSFAHAFGSGVTALEKGPSGSGSPNCDQRQRSRFASALGGHCKAGNSLIPCCPLMFVCGAMQ